MGSLTYSKHTFIYNAKITFILLPAHEASEPICVAYLQGLTWPNYAWIVADRSVEELFLSTQCDPQSKLMATKHILLIQNQLEPDSDSELVSGLHRFGGC